VIARPASLLPIGVLTLLVALTFWLSRFVQPPDFRADRKALHEPDLIIENFSAQQLNSAGDIQYAVNAARMTHFADDDSSHLEKVTMIATNSSQPNMTITAPEGKLFRRADGSDEVMMQGGVLVQSVATEKYPALKLTTPKIVVLPDTHQALSNDGVVLESASGTLNARKFTMNTKTRRIVFETVDIAYLPRSNK